jgi:GNAT superfamily N-acetyltransferase
MSRDLTLRTAVEADAAEISRLVRETIRVSNALDYPEAVIERLVAAFSPEAVAALMRRRAVLVACKGGRILGTAGLEGDTLRTVFVLPEAQGLGVGRRLMAAIEGLAGERGVEILQVPASLTARPFYSHLGYRESKTVFFGEERTVLMQKDLDPI